MVSNTPRPHFTPGKDPVPILLDTGWTPEPVWTSGKSRPHRDLFPDRSARSQSLYRLRYPGTQQKSVPRIFPGRGGGKRGRCLGMTTLPHSRADSLEIWVPQPPRDLWGCNKPEQGLLCHLFSWICEHM